MTDTQKAAMEQALEALDRLYLPGELERVNAAITALRAALAETAKPVAFSQFLSDVMTAAGLLGHGKRDKALAARISDFAAQLRTTPQPPAPAPGYCKHCKHYTVEEPLPAPAVDYKPLTDPHDHPEPHSYKWTQQEMDYINKRVAAAIAAHEAKKGGA